MQALILAVKAIPMLGGAAAGGAAATGGALGTLATVAGVAGGLMSTLYQRNVAAQAEAVAKDNADRARHSSQIEQQDRDTEAAHIIAEETASRAGSGFASTSGTFQRMDRRNRILARRDAERIRHGGEMEAAGFESQAAAAAAEKRNLGTSLLFDAIGGAAQIQGSLISNASLVSRQKTNSLARIRIRT